MKFASVLKTTVFGVTCLFLSASAEARIGRRIPASESHSVRNKLALKDKKSAKYTKRKKALSNEVDPTAQRDLTFESHRTFENDAEGMTRKVDDRSFETLVN